MSFLDEVKWNDRGLVPVVTVAADSGELLMQAWANREAVQAAVDERRGVYWSRSRSRIWRKGEESGNVQHLIEILLDCDGDTICYRVEQVGGGACHTGRRNCFFRKLENKIWREFEIKESGNSTLALLEATLEARKSAAAEESYVASLYAKGLNKILEKVGEEATEVILAAKDAEAGGEKQREALIAEAADLWFHSMVMLRHLDLSQRQVLAELEKRFKMSGHAEKSSRK